ncbi:unnamed protein product [Rotaria sp. Silwood1]|nr:unnamed protein product [Rotaria sp. Silwood1]CAF1438302.1 unnamed protein product [Rotaria sp. Silwood1]CAF3621753.1 unnamed protein product [Rotaria sp. Silwood1]
MAFTTIITDLHSTNKSLLTKQWFDYTPEMNAIIDALHKRIFNLEITLQANNQILDRSQTITNDHLLSHRANITVTQEQLSQKSRRSSLVLDQHSLNLTLEKQFDKLNLPSDVFFDQTAVDNIDPSNISLRAGKSNHISSSLSKLPKLLPINLTPNQMKTRAYELVAIFENAFDELNIIHKSLSINDFNKNNNQFQFDDLNSTNINLYSSVSQNSSCNPFALNLAGIFIMNERDKLRYEIEYFFHILILFFRALLLEFETDFLTSINHINNTLPSIQLIELNNRLKISQDKIKKLSFIKKNFQTEKSQQFNELISIKSQLKDYLMEEKYRSKISLRYCNDWKKNHILQWIQMLLDIEQNYTKTIHQYENILKQTDIIHQETIKILTKQNNEMKFNVNKWYEYYQNETNRFDKELINFRQEFNQIKRQRQYMYEEYQRMKIIVDEYNQMKINEKLLLEKQKQEEEAIKRIQAWWRGTMVRHIKQKRRKKKKK